MRFASLRTLTVGTLVLVAASCGGRSGLGGEDESGSGSGEGETAGESSASASATADGESDAESDAESNGVTSGAEDDEGNLPDFGLPGSCPEEQDVWVEFELGDYGEDEALDLEMECEIAGLEDLAPGLSLDLINCVDADDMMVADVELVFRSEPWADPLLAPGQAVRVHYVIQPPFDTGSWFTLRHPDGWLYAGGWSGSSPLPSSKPAWSWDPVGLAVVDQGCPWNWDDSGCAEVERQMLAVDFDGQEAEAYDNQSTSVGQLESYLVVVEDLLHYNEVTCPDFPSDYTRGLMISVPEG